MKIYADGPEGQEEKKADPRGEDLTPSQDQGTRVFKTLTPSQKLRFIWDYYKIPIGLGLFALLFVFTLARDRMNAKTPILYVGAINVSVDEPLTRVLTTSYLEEAGANPKKEEVLLYTGLYLTDDTSSEAFSYSYASRIKILGAIDDKTLDVVLFDQEAFDAFAQSGYLLDLSMLEGGRLSLVENIELREEETQGAEEEGKTEGNIEEESKEEEGEEREEEEKYTIITYPMGVDLSVTSIFGGFTGKVYAGIIANTDHLEESLDYLEYLTQSASYAGRGQKVAQR